MFTARPIWGWSITPLTCSGISTTCWTARGGRTACAIGFVWRLERLQLRLLHPHAGERNLGPGHLHALSARGDRRLLAEKGTPHAAAVDRDHRLRDASHVGEPTVRALHDGDGGGIAQFASLGYPDERHARHRYSHSSGVRPGEKPGRVSRPPRHRHGSAGDPPARGWLWRRAGGGTVAVAAVDRTAAGTGRDRGEERSIEGRSRETTGARSASGHGAELHRPD